MKFVRILAVVVIGSLIASAASAADFGVRAGRYKDAGDEFVGAEVLFDAGVLNVNPNIEYSLAENVTAGTANLDVTFDILRFASVSPYIGAGLGLAYVDDDFFGSQTDIVGNLIGGVSFDLDFLKPYAQVKYFRMLDEDNRGTASDDVAFTIGLRF